MQNYENKTKAELRNMQILHWVALPLTAISSRQTQHGLSVFQNCG